MQDHPVGLADAVAVAGKVLLRESQRGQGQGGLLLVEDAHDHLFPEVHRPGGDAKVDVDVLLRVLLEDDAPVLRQAPLRDVEVAHDLQPGDEPVGHLLGQAQLLLAHAVDPVPDEEILLHRLDVDVGGPGDVGVLDDAVGKLDDGGGVLALQVGGPELPALGIRVVGVADRLGHRPDVDVVIAAGCLRVLEELLDQRFEERAGDDAHLIDREVGGLGEGLPFGIVERVCHHHRHRSRPEALVGEDPFAADDGVAGRLHELLVDLELLDFYHEGQVGQL